MMLAMKQILATITIITTLFLGIMPAYHAYAWLDAEKEEASPPLILPKGDFEELRKVGVSTVTEVINPMTVKLKDGRMIALTGLDYPDLDFYDPGELAVTAQQVLEDFLVGKKVIIYQTPKSDAGRKNRMGHDIAHLARIDENHPDDESAAIWAEGVMLSLGLARTRTTKYNRQMAGQMFELEAKAREQKVGLWSMDKYSVLTPEQATEHIGSFQIVEGKIQSISRHKNNLYINFGGNWRDDFTIGISGNNMRTFTNERIYPDRWNGEHIRVRGWVESYNGPFIEIDHPEKIELISIKNEQDPLENNADTPTGDSPITFKGNSLPEYN